MMVQWCNGTVSLALRLIGVQLSAKVLSCKQTSGKFIYFYLFYFIIESNRKYTKRNKKTQ